MFERVGNGNSWSKYYFCKAKTFSLPFLFVYFYSFYSVDEECVTEVRWLGCLRLKLFPAAAFLRMSDVCHRQHN